MKKTARKFSVKLDAPTSMLFAHMMSEGMVKFKVDKDLPRNEVHATIEKGTDGKSNVFISASEALAACFYEQ